MAFKWETMVVGFLRSYWQRFLGLVQFTDEAHGTKGKNRFATVAEYLQTENVSPWIMYFADTAKSTGRI